MSNSNQVSEFGDGTSDTAHRIGHEFVNACRDVGFAYLINTGVPQERVDEMFQWVSIINEVVTSEKARM